MIEQQLDKLVREFVDQQCGLDCAGYAITFGGTNISVMGGQMSDDSEWQEMARELIEYLELELSDFGPLVGRYELTGCGNTGFRLMNSEYLASGKTLY